jgi:hypothetical protein
MSKNSGISVNGIMLEEYVRDRELISEEIERINLIGEVNNRVFLNRHISPKYKETKEKNGRVKILGNFEKNHANFENFMIRQMKEEYKVSNLTLIILLCYEKDRFYSSADISDIIKEIADKNNIELTNLNPEPGVRLTLSVLYRKEISMYMERVKPNSTAPMEYRIVEDGLEKLSLEKALELSKNNLPRKSNQNMRVKTKKEIPVEKYPEVIESEKINKISKEIPSVVEKLKELGLQIVINGDVKIYF